MLTSILGSCNEEKRYFLIASGGRDSQAIYRLDMYNPTEGWLVIGSRTTGSAQQSQCSAVVVGEDDLCLIGKFDEPIEVFSIAELLKPVPRCTPRFTRLPLAQSSSKLPPSAVLAASAAPAASAALRSQDNVYWWDRSIRVADPSILPDSLLWITHATTRDIYGRASLRVYYLDPTLPNVVNVTDLDSALLVETTALSWHKHHMKARVCDFRQVALSRDGTAIELTHPNADN